MRQDSDSDKIAENDCSYLVLCAFFDKQDASQYPINKSP